MLRSEFQNIKRLVVKVGSNVVTDANGKFHLQTLSSLAQDIKELRKLSIEVVLVSSGAVNIGKRFISPKLFKKDKICGQQAASSVGQPILMKKYQELFCAQELTCSQVLLTHDDFKSRHRFLNARRTIEALLASGIVPIVNENDAISFTEITVGDNDHLAAKVCALIQADALQLITSARGLYDKDPKDKDAKIIRSIASDAMPQIKYGPMSVSGRGGMESKVAAVQKALELSVKSLISSKDLKRPILDAICFEDEGTFFSPRELSKLAKNKLWLSSIKLSEGAIEVDTGAYQALLNKKSLLSSGVLGPRGEFSQGDCVSIIHDNSVVGRGIISFGHLEVQAIAGKHSSEIDDLLGPGREREVIHVEKLVMEEVE